jgi:CRP-like cAMP-binding protein
VSIDNFVMLATKYGVLPWRPDLDAEVVYAADSAPGEELGAIEERFAILEGMWALNGPAIMATLASARAARGAIVSRRGARRGGITQGGAAENPYAVQLAALLHRFKEFLGERDDYQGAWAAYQELTRAAKDRPPLSQDELISILSTVPFFENSPRDFLVELAQCAKQARFNAGEIIMREGDIGREMFIITSGECEILAGDDQKVVAELGFASFLGEIALLKNTRRNATARTKVASDCAIIFKRDFQQLLAKYPDTRDSIWEIAIEKTMKREAALASRDTLKRVPLFQGLNEAFVRRLVDNLTMKHFPAGSTLMSQGEQGSELFIMHDGQVNVIVATPGMDPGEQELRVVATLGPGDFVGEGALVTRDPRSATVIATVDTVACLLRKESFNRLLSDAPKVRAKLNEYLRKMSKKKK